ncbi:transposase family protein [Streptomyces antimycoticus]|nr:transposase family protein [Streptomyces antimycoticus]
MRDASIFSIFLPRSPDPREGRGRRHSLAGLLPAGVAAVIAGSRSFAAIGQWAADAGPEVLAVLGPARGPAEESTFRRAFALARRTIKMALAPARIGFEGAAQVALRRTVVRKGKKTVEVVHLITSDRSASPETLAAWVRRHGHTENKLHWVRDVTYQEDKSLVRTGNAPRLMASLRSLAISILRLAGHADIAAANRHHARDPQRTLKLLQAA